MLILLLQFWRENCNSRYLSCSKNIQSLIPFRLFAIHEWKLNLGVVWELYGCISSVGAPFRHELTKGSHSLVERTSSDRPRWIDEKDDVIWYVRNGVVLPRFLHNFFNITRQEIFCQFDGRHVWWGDFLISCALSKDKMLISYIIVVTYL